MLDKSDSDQVLKGLKSASGYLRRELGRALNLRHTPELTFFRDDSMAKGAKIQSKSAVIADLSKIGYPLFYNFFASGLNNLNNVSERSVWNFGVIVA